jgi:hypothetical protein
MKFLRFMRFVNAGHIGLSIAMGIFLLVGLFGSQQTSFGVERQVVTVMMALCLTLQIGEPAFSHHVQSLTDNSQREN